MHRSVSPVPGTEIWRERALDDCAAGGTTIRASKATPALPTNDEISSTRSPGKGTPEGRRRAAVPSCHRNKRGRPPPDLEMEASGVRAAGMTGGCSVCTVWGKRTDSGASRLFMDLGRWVGSSRQLGRN